MFFSHSSIPSIIEDRGPLRQTKDRTLFVSDIHIHDHQSRAWAELQALVVDHTPTQLVLLGDIFHAWIGWDCAPKLHAEWTAWIEALTAQGTHIYWLPGNHDALLVQPKDTAGMTVLPDPCIVDLEGQRTLLTHGDLFCSLDRLHQYWRKVQHALGSYFLLLPKALRQRIRTSILRQSQRYAMQRAETTGRIPKEIWEAVAAEHRLNLIIHGHIHQAAYDRRTGYQYISLGDWHRGPQWLVVEAQEGTMLERSGTSGTTVLHKHIPLGSKHSPE